MEVLAPAGVNAAAMLISAVKFDPAECKMGALASAEAVAAAML